MKKLADAKDNPQLWKTEATCSGKGWDQSGKIPCYALWEVTAKDIKKRSHTDYGGGTDTYYGFVCPDCGCFTELPEKDIPHEVRSHAATYIGKTAEEFDR